MLPILSLQAFSICSYRMQCVHYLQRHLLNLIDFKSFASHLVGGLLFLFNPSIHKKVWCESPRPEEWPSYLIRDVQVQFLARFQLENMPQNLSSEEKDIFIREGHLKLTAFSFETFLELLTWSLQKKLRLLLWCTSKSIDSGNPHTVCLNMSDI